MKVLLIGNQANTILLFRRRLIEKLIERDVTVYTLTMDNDPEKFKKIAEIGAVPEQYFFSRAGVNPFSDFLNTYRLSQKIKKIQPNVVLCFFPKPVIFGSIASKCAGVKNINILLEGLGYCFTEHPTPSSFKKKLTRAIQVLLYKCSLRLGKEVIFLNSDDYNDLVVNHNIPVKSKRIIGGIGVNLNEYQYSKPELTPIHFTMVSRLLIDKGVREFINAAQLVKASYPDAHFSIAGAFDENPGGITHSEYAEWVKQGNVEFLGQISNIKDYLLKGSVFVLPSYREGVPKSTQEAMAVGRAIITTDVPGCRETVIEGYNGFLIPPWNADDLAKKMVTFIENPQLIVKMGVASRRMAEEKFDEEKICDNLINILMS